MMNLDDLLLFLAHEFFPSHDQYKKLMMACSLKEKMLCSAPWGSDLERTGSDHITIYPVKISAAFGNPLFFFLEERKFFYTRESRYIMLNACWGKGIRIASFEAGYLPWLKFSLDYSGYLEFIAEGQLPNICMLFSTLDWDKI